MDTDSFATAALVYAAEPWPEGVWLRRSEGFAEDLAAPAGARCTAPQRRAQAAEDRVRRIGRLAGDAIAAAMRPPRPTLA